MGKFPFIVTMLFFLFGCTNESIHMPNDYPKQKSDVINTHGSIENIEQLDQFVNHVKSEKNAEVRIVHYTIEGDPILLDLAYDGKIIQAKYDNTLDQFGVGKIDKYSCESISKIETETKTSYELDCGGQQEEILHFDYDTEQQDKFDFHLKYGFNKKNEVDTVNQKLIKDLQNGEIVAVSDFQFGRNELNQIYKAMILANFFAEKKLTTSCNKEPHESYDLTVWINGGERHFEWSECDKSKHGLQMKKMKNDIIQVIQENETYKSLPPVKGSYE
ncbi:DUF4362 domain-containing protein [Cytobacillus depressus]|uniref:DUF4362 domain-containing protein n=1 Tax=Cytobacillus depressus TaxID=1602942 RepID=A0A6L3V769_9BACI|nr:DUF4362 domain-containing protein [Cytobacillus depressus]KAB2336100.1 DUF4362 domain-containing protein [Cytobacillus depressus]